MKRYYIELFQKRFAELTAYPFSNPIPLEKLGQLSDLGYMALREVIENSRKIRKKLNMYQRLFRNSKKGSSVSCRLNQTSPRMSLNGNEELDIYIIVKLRRECEKYRRERLMIEIMNLDVKSMISNVVSNMYPKTSI